MASIRFRRFTHPAILIAADRAVLRQFFETFAPSLAEADIQLPSQDLEHDAYCQALARLLMAPNGLPHDVNDALHLVNEMASDEGVNRLQIGMATVNLNVSITDKSSALDIAMQVWLADPTYFQQRHSEHQLLRLSSFEYFAPLERVDRSKTFLHPTQLQLTAMEQVMQPVFASKNRGHRAVQIAVHALDDEYWFWIEHGDLLSRTKRIEEGRFETMQFRPAKDNFLVYSPTFDEIRINAPSVWQKNLYRETFGQHFFQNTGHFSETPRYTLAPLNEEGADALSVQGVDRIKKVVLQELEIRIPSKQNHIEIHRSKNLVDSLKGTRALGKIPKSFQLRRAVFDVRFTDSPKSRRIEVRVPNILKLGRYCDTHAVYDWLTQRGFKPESQTASAPAVAIPATATA